MRRTFRSDGITLIELLVVIAIIGLLLSLLLPALQSAREAGRKSQCQHHLKNMALATLNFEAIQTRFPPAAQDRDGKVALNVKPKLARHNGISFLLPHFEQGSTYERINYDFDWKHPRNEPHTKQDLGGILICPSAPSGRQQYHVTDYEAAVRIDVSSPEIERLVSAGYIDDKDHAPPQSRLWDGILQVDFLDDDRRGRDRTDRRVVFAAHVKDGLSNTWLWLESAGKPFIYQLGGLVPESERIRYTSHNSRFRWASQETWMAINNSCGEQQLINCSNLSQPYSFHLGGTNVAYADGSVRFHTDDLDAQLFVSLLTLAGRETPMSTQL